MIRQLGYLVALARDQHFARAAAACNVTQPTLSAGIKHLEEIFGVLIVERGQRYVRLTDEGERVLYWAQRVTTGYEGLVQELSELRSGLAGRLRLGAIPVTLPIVPNLIESFSEQYPGTTITVLTMSSVEIQRSLDNFDLDVGLTYLDNEPLVRVRTLPLYRERYLLLTPTGSRLAHRTTVSWAEAAGLPLGLLTQQMQNRRILDMHFAAAGVEVITVFETNSLFTLRSNLARGNWSTILPHTALLLGEMPDIAAIPLVEPTAAHLVGLVASDRDPLTPVARALLQLAPALDIVAA